MQTTGDAIEDAIQQLTDDERSSYYMALSHVYQLGTSWKHRYAYADLAMLTLGAYRTPSGKPTQKTIYTMPCGCAYSLFYAKPSTYHKCVNHPGKPVTKKDILSVVMELVEALCILTIGWSLLMLVVYAFTRPVNLNRLGMDFAIGICAAVAFYVIKIVKLRFKLVW